MRVGDIVVRRRLPFHDLSEGELATAMVGTVEKVSRVKLAGGVKARVIVRWENIWNSTGTHDNRMLQVVE